MRLSFSLMLCFAVIGCDRLSTSSTPKDASKTERDEVYCVDYPLHCAARDGDAVLIRQLVKYGYDVKGKDKSQQSPIHLAVRSGQMVGVRVLIELKASLEDTDWQGRTPLLVAADSTVPLDMFRGLLDLGADSHLLNVQNNLGETSPSSSILAFWVVYAAELHPT